MTVVIGFNSAKKSFQWLVFAKPTEQFFFYNLLIVAWGVSVE